MTSIESIIDRLGGAEAAAKLTGVGAEAIRKWRQARMIPAKHWPAVMNATGLPIEALSGERASIAGDAPPGATAALALDDGSVFWGRGFGAHSSGRVGEVCFNTGMTGYQETMTDPSYAGQHIAFTFPHIGNVGVNPEDLEATNIAALGVIVKQDVTVQSNWRATQGLQAWMRTKDLPGIAGVDTRALTVRVRDGGPPTGALSFPAGRAVRPGGADGAGEGLAGAGGDGPRPRGELHADLYVGRGRLVLGRAAAGAGAAASRRRGRLRGEAEYFAVLGLGRLPGHGGAGDGDGRGHPAA